MAGWGATETGGLPSEVLMAAEITVISDEGTKFSLINEQKIKNIYICRMFRRLRPRIHLQRPDDLRSGRGERRVPGKAVSL